MLLKFNYIANISRAKFSSSVRLGFVLIVLLSAVDTYAQKALDEKPLLQLFDKINQLDAFSYIMQIESSIPGSTEKAPLKSVFNYASKKDFVIYNSVSSELFFLCEKGHFKVDSAEKIVYYKIFGSDSETSKVKQTYLEQLASISLDSTFLNHAAIAKKKQVKNKWEYTLSYPSGYWIKSFYLLMDPASASPEVIRYTVERPSNSSPYAIEIQQKITIDHYSESKPSEVKNILKYSRDLYQYLRQSYSGYTIKEI